MSDAIPKNGETVWCKRCKENVVPSVGHKVLIPILLKKKLKQFL